VAIFYQVPFRQTCIRHHRAYGKNC
jgi:hypothetical protein